MSGHIARLVFTIDALCALAHAKLRRDKKSKPNGCVSFLFPDVTVRYTSSTRTIPVAATQALDQAHWKLKPPMRPSTSRISPTR